MTDRIFKFSPIHASFINFAEFPISVKSCSNDIPSHQILFAIAKTMRETIGPIPQIARRVPITYVTVTAKPKPVLPEKPVDRYPGPFGH